MLLLRAGNEERFVQYSNGGEERIRSQRRANRERERMIVLRFPTLLLNIADIYE